MNICKKIKLRAGYCRVSHIAKQVDRSPMTVIRWENDGLIPKVQRDSRGWRIYTKGQVKDIVSLVRRTKYFSRQSSQ